MVIKAENDLINIIEMIYKICDHQQVLSMFKKGPPNNQGFLWCDKTGGPDKHFTELEAKALNEISEMVLINSIFGWDKVLPSFLLLF